MAIFSFFHGKDMNLSGDVDEITEFRQFFCVVDNKSGNTVYASNRSDFSGENSLEIPPYSARIIPVDNILNRFFLSGNGVITAFGFDTRDAACNMMLMLLSKHEKIGDNLLINPDFSINQRGSTVYSTQGITCDMWKIDSNGTVSLQESGAITLSSSDSKPTWFYQYFENPFLLDDKSITLTVCDGNNIVHSATGYVPQGHISESKCVINKEFCGAALQLWKRNDDILIVQIALPEGVTVSIKWVKLEIGNTPSAFITPDYSTELAKCQRYFQIRSTGDIAEVDLRPSMAQNIEIHQRSDGCYEYSAL